MVRMESRYIYARPSLEPRYVTLDHFGYLVLVFD